jgi:hypothetical protein
MIIPITVITEIFVGVIYATATVSSSYTAGLFTLP